MATRPLSGTTRLPLLALAATACAPSPGPYWTPEPEVTPEMRFRALETRMLGAEEIQIAFIISATGAVEVDLFGSLLKSGDEIELSASGDFAGQPARLRLYARGATYEYGNEPGRERRPIPPALWESLVIGFTRMGVLHNLARLTGDAPPDHADGGAAEWVVVDDFGAATDDPGRISFDLTVSGQPSGSASLELDGAGLPAVRRQTVQFPNGEMRVVERYSDVVIRP